MDGFPSPKSKIHLSQITMEMKLSFKSPLILEFSAFNSKTNSVSSIMSVENRKFSILNYIVYDHFNLIVTCKAFLDHRE